MARCKNMLNGFVIVLMGMMLLSSCHTPKQVIVETKTETRYVDSVIYKDSITYIPQEYYYNVVWPYDSLYLETSQASAVAWVDSTFLRGYIKNKKIASQQVIEKTEYITRDSISYVEKPVPYPVVEHVKNPVNKWLLWWSIGSSLVALGAACWIFRKRLMKLIALI